MTGGGGRVLAVTWAGGGNIPPMVTLAGSLAARGVAVEGYGPGRLAARFAAEGVPFAVRDAGKAEWDPATMAADVAGAVAGREADLAIVDYMLPAGLLGVMAAGRPAVALVHTLYGALLADGAPNPIGMAASVEALDAVAGTHGLAPVTRMGDVLDRCAAVLVTAPA